MLFNSYIFLFAFLPVCLAGYYALARWGRLIGAIWLVVASLGFYAYWNLAYTALLIASIVFNYVIGLLIGRAPVRSKPILVVGITVNLLALSYYKYANFLLDNLNAALSTSYTMASIILPLGISFFTFTQIAYLVDVYRRKANEPNFIHYSLFVTYFPHLIAGPILHHAEMMPQFSRAGTYVWRTGRFAVGLTMLAIGLVKKVILADNIAAYASPVFAAVDGGHHPGAAEAWGAALGYTFQLYFDFSGYCDMAMGLSLMFGIGLPLNFNSPYKAVGIIDFWRRWHMTLSRFLRDYLYIPLGGNRKGVLRRQGNLIATMLLGGLWHGAAWTFVVWGGLHGCYLVINHAWSSLRGRSWTAPPGQMERLAGWGLTFICVVVGWVFFRAATLAGAASIISAMFGQAPQAAPAVTDLSVLWVMCALLAGIALCLPNTQEILQEHLPEICQVPLRDGAPHPAPISFRFSWGWAPAVAALLALALAGLPQPTSFLYFNF